MFGRAREIANRARMLLTGALVESADDSTAIQLLKIIGMEALDRVQRFQNYGFTSVPPADSEAIVGALGDSIENPVALAVDSGEHRPTGLATGETCMYSQHGQTIKQDENGDTIFNGGSDFMVRYTALETAFNQLKSDHDNHLIKFAAHTHLGVPHATSVTGPASTVPGYVPETPSTANIAPAKIDEIKVP